MKQDSATGFSRMNLDSASSRPGIYQRQSTKHAYTWAPSRVLRVRGGAPECRKVRSDQKSCSILLSAPLRHLPIYLALELD
eukprot:2333035-Pyramimonas_sp.AAC.1